MTTRITVNAHAGWPVEVQFVDTTYDGQPIAYEFKQKPTIVPPHITQDFYVHSGRSVHISEVKTDPVPAPPKPVDPEAAG